MSDLFTGLFKHSDRIQMESLNQRLAKSQIINANVANAETPGYRAIGYDFEEQLQTLAKLQNSQELKTSNSLHLLTKDVQSNGAVETDVYVIPTESVGSDGNTVDLDKELASFAKNQVIFRTSVESINRKIALLRYAIAGG